MRYKLVERYNPDLTEAQIINLETNISLLIENHTVYIRVYLYRKNTFPEASSLHEAFSDRRIGRVSSMAYSNRIDGQVVPYIKIDNGDTETLDYIIEYAGKGFERVERYENKILGSFYVVKNYSEWKHLMDWLWQDNYAFEDISIVDRTKPEVSYPMLVKLTWDSYNEEFYIHQSPFGRDVQIQISKQIRRLLG